MKTRRDNEDLNESEGIANVGKMYSEFYFFYPFYDLNDTNNFG